MTRLWLVERTYDDRNLITLVYATPDGERQLTRQLSADVVRGRGRPVTAAVETDEEDLRPSPESDRERYAAEARRMAERYEPDDPV